MIQQVSQPPTKKLQELIEIVLEDRVLQERIKEAPDKDSFLNLIVELGREKGYSFTTEELEIMMAESNQGLAESPADTIEVYRFQGFIKDAY